LKIIIQKYNQFLLASGYKMSHNASPFPSPAVVKHRNISNLPWLW